MLGLAIFIGVGVVVLALVDIGLYRMWLGRYNWR